MQCDQIIVLHHFYVKRDYPEKLRRIRFYDREQNRMLVFLTNNFTLPALTIAKIYKCRWQIELFFQWIKQHLRIEAFYETPENAVKTQIWIAISVAEPLHNSTDSECHPFRENADPAGPFGHRLQRSRGAVS